MKKIAVMQPYFFPYLGYFSLIKHTDEFMLFDPVQFIRHGWIERNRVLKQNEGWLYIKVPLVKHDRDTLIKDVRIDTTQDWQAKLLAQLQTYKKVAPYFDEVYTLVKGAISGDHEDIVSLDKACLLAVCDYLDIKKELPVFSELGLEIRQPQAADEWALEICKAKGDVDEYWNPPGGAAFFNREKYDAAGIKLVFQSVQLEPYDQRRQPFEAGLSIIDVMMFNSPAEINTMLDRFSTE